MKSQIKGLSQAQRNIQDGISLVQVTEGALTEIENMSQRMRELSVQAANGTLSGEDREKIQAEINQLVDEVDKMTKDTEFNGIKVLQGTERVTTIIENTIGGMPAWVTVPDGLSPPSALGENATAEIDFSNLTSANVSDLIGQGFFSTCCTCTEKYSIKFTDKSEPSTGRPNPVISINISSISTSEDLVKEIVNQSKPYFTHFTEFKEDPSKPGKLIIYDNRPDQKPNISSGYGVVKKGYIETITTESDPDILIQSGPNSGNTTGLSLPNTDIGKLGFDTINVSDIGKAQRSINVIDSCLNYLNTERAVMGAYNNRLEAENNVATIMETNLTSSKSKITDVDMAKEVVNLSKYNILQQSSMSIMSIFKNITETTMKTLLQ